MKRKIFKKKRKITFKLPFNHDYTFTILLFGEPRTERTGLAQRYCYNIFDSSEKLTIGVDFYMKTIKMHGKRVKLQIWDISSEERYQILFSSYSLGANAAIFIYDIRKSKILNPMFYSMQVIRDKTGDIPIILIGTKLDLKENRELNKDKLFEIAEKYDISSYNEISTKIGEDVENTFGILTDLLIQQFSNY